MNETTSLAWVAKVLEAIHAVASRPQSRVALVTVGEALGLAHEAMSDQSLTTGEGVGAALFQALGDLDGLGLIEFANVAYGNSMTDRGRDVYDLGLETLWPAIFDAHLDDRAAAFLHRLVKLSEIRMDGWAERHAVPAKQVYADLGWFVSDDDYDMVNDIHALVGVLRGKEMVRVSGPGNFGNMLVTPSYLAMVRITGVDPRGAGRAAGILDWFEPVPGWEEIEADLDGLKIKLDMAGADHDFEDVGRRVREIAADAVMHVADTTMVPAGQKAPGDRDADEWFELYLGARLSGGSNKEMRDFLRASLRLAHSVTHGSRNRIAGAVASSQGLVALVRTLQAVERTTGSPPLPATPGAGS